MPVTPDKPAPYTAAQVVIDLIDRHRNRGLPTPVDGEILARAGVSDSLIPRTLQALVSLDLIDEQKRPTPMFEAIRLAPEPEYHAKLIEWLSAAYADVLKFVDPSTDSQTAVRDAFRSYQPIGQQDRMASLFSGLFRSAGIVPTDAFKPKTVNMSIKTGLKMGTKTVLVPRRSRLIGGRGAGGGAGSPSGLKPDLPPALGGLLASLPDPATGWTQAERNRFVATFEAVVDFCFPPRAEAAPEPLTAEDDDASEAV